MPDMGADEITGTRAPEMVWLPAADKVQDWTVFDRRRSEDDEPYVHASVAAEMLAALEAIAKLPREPDAPEYWARLEAIDAEVKECGECEEWRLRQHPIQKMCDTHYSAYAKERRQWEDACRIHRQHRPVEIARAAIAKYRTTTEAS